ncbi:MAG TPA: ATP synthase F1 subunit delta [Lutibacter sp.]|nr:ATP synthase F1 subunit delta [Lutibacter sp.]
MSTRAANRYAKALLDLAFEENQGEAVFKDMQLVAQTISENAELQLLLDSPIFKITDKKEALLSIFGSKISKLSSNLIGLLETNKRMSLLQLIAIQYSVLYNEKNQFVEASVTTAFPIDDKMKTLILAKAQELANGKEVHLHNKVDESIIGGFVLRVGDVQIDASILNKLGNLKRELIK